MFKLERENRTESEEGGDSLFAMLHTCYGYSLVTARRNTNIAPVHTCSFSNTIHHTTTPDPRVVAMQ